MTYLRKTLLNIFTIFIIFTFSITVNAQNNPFSNKISISVKNQSQKIVENIENKKNTLSNDNFNKLVDDFLIQLNILEKKYSNNESLKNIIGYLFFEISKFKNYNQNNNSGDLENLICQIAGGCDNLNKDININDNNIICDTPDIILDNGQVWSACNVGTSKAGLGKESYGLYFQWGREKGFKLNENIYKSDQKISNYNPENDNSGFIITPNGEFESWMGGNIKNIWGENQKGVCPEGYKIPSSNDWIKAYDSILGNDWKIKVGTKEKNDELIKKISEKLLLPNAGQIYTKNGNFSWQGKLARYWTSTISSTNNNNAFMSGWYSDSDKQGWINSSYSYGHAWGINVRCIKNNNNNNNNNDNINNDNINNDNINNNNNLINYGDCKESGTLYYKSGNSCVWASFSCNNGKYFRGLQFSPSPPLPEISTKFYNNFSACEIGESNNFCRTNDGKTINNNQSSNLYFYSESTNGCESMELVCNNGIFRYGGVQFSPMPRVPEKIYSTSNSCYNDNINQNKEGNWKIEFTNGIVFSPAPPSCGGKTYREGDSCSNVGYSCIEGNYQYTCQKKAEDITINFYGSSLNNCSSPGSSITNSIWTNSNDIKICQEFRIDNPNRRNDNFYCSDENFIEITKANGWNKNKGHWENYTRLQDNKIIVPGDYRVVIKNQKGETIYGPWQSIKSSGNFSNPNNCFYTRYKATTVEQAIYYLINTKGVHYNSGIDWSIIEKEYGIEIVNNIRLDIIRMGHGAMGALDIVKKYSKTSKIPEWNGPTYFEGNWGPYYGEKSNPAIFSFNSWYEGKSPWVVGGCLQGQNYEWVKGGIVNCNNRTYSGNENKKIRLIESKDTLSVSKLGDSIKFTVYGLDYHNAKACQNVISHPYVPSAENPRYCSDTSKYVFLKNLKGWSYDHNKGTWNTELKHDPKLFAPGIKIQGNKMDSRTGEISIGKVITIIE